jgi:uncharacterized protein (TIGR03545 family)
MKWIRWPGLIAFLASVAVIAVLWFLIIDTLIKTGIERTGTAIVGAKVELTKADLTLFPLGLTLTGLEVTNPDSPMTNAFEAGKIAFTMDGVNLLRRKVIIDEMAAEGVRLNTPRKTSGEVKKAPKAEKAGPPLLTFGVPDVKEILAKEDLRSIKAITELKAAVDGAKDKWREDLKSLPDRNKIDEYKKRIDGLKASGNGVAGAVGGAAEALKLQDDIKKDLKRINDFKNSLDGKVLEYKRLAREAADAPGKDIDRIMKKYSLTPEGITNLSRYFVGGRLAEWFEKSLGWYRRAAPVLKQAHKTEGVEVVKPPRGRGEYVRFQEREPLPDFLIRKALVSVSIPAGDIKGVITGITPDQHILGAPLRFDFSGVRLKGLDSVKVNGVINRVEPERPKDTVNMDVAGLKVQEMVLSDSKDLPVVLKGAWTDFSLRAGVIGEKIDGRLTAGLKSVVIAAGGADSENALQRGIASALSGVKGFNIRADVTGTLDDYDMKVSSDLDRVLKDSVGKVVNEQAAELEKRLKAEVMKQVDGPMKELQGSLSGLDAIDGELKGLTDQMTGLLAEAGKKAAPGGFKLPKLPF